jgi:hypothetical protein
MTNTVHEDMPGTGPSPALWGDAPRIEEYWTHPSIGYHWWDDFENFADHVSDQDVQRYASYIDTGVTFKQLTGTAGVGGAIELAGNDADNDEGVLSTHGPAFMVSDTAAQAKKLWFEARFKKASIANNALAIFLGLAFDHGSSEKLSKTLCLTDDDGALGAFSYLGFHVDQANGDAIDAVYKAEGQAQTVNKAGIHVPVADTYVKLGLKYDPLASAAKRIKWYVDGVEQSTYVTATQIAAATFPDAEPLALVWCGKVGTGAESKAQMSWWRAFQSR